MIRRTQRSNGTLTTLIDSCLQACHSTWSTTANETTLQEGQQYLYSMKECLLTAQRISTSGSAPDTVYAITADKWEIHRLVHGR